MFPEGIDLSKDMLDLCMLYDGTCICAKISMLLVPGRRANNHH